RALRHETVDCDFCEVVAMAIVTIEMLEGRSIEQKRRLVEAITKAMVEIANARASTLHIVIRDVPKTNWGIDGVLASQSADRPVNQG
ncbi:MAG: tautomerase family protein, partial [Vulcanimicrobiaceae bacterium]